MGSFVVKDVNSLIDAGNQVDMIHLVAPRLFDGRKKYRLGNIRVQVIPMNPKNPLSILKARWQLRKHWQHHDLIHSMAISALLPLVIKRPPKTWIHTEHWSVLTTASTLGPVMRALVPVAKSMLKRPDLVTAVCEFLARPIREIRGEKPLEIVGCIVKRPEKLVERRKAKISDFTGENPDSVLKLVSIGGLVDRKDPLLAVQTIKALQARGVQASLTWVGEGPLREAVQSLAVELGISDRVHLLGIMPVEQVYEQLGKADLFFGPTKADNFFVSCAEGLSAGRPVVVGSNGGHGEYTDPAVGTLVDDANAQTYAQAIIDTWIRSEGKSAKDISYTLGQQFEPETIGAKYSELYQRFFRE